MKSIPSILLILAIITQSCSEGKKQEQDGLSRSCFRNGFFLRPNTLDNSQDSAKSPFMIATHLSDLWDDVRGDIECANGKVWFTGSVPKTTKFLLYDFSMEPGDSVPVSYTAGYYSSDSDSDVVQKNHTLFLIDCFYNEAFMDTIYEFVLEGFGIGSDTDDVVVYVGKTKGEAGMYICDILHKPVSTRLVYKTFGNPFLERIPDKNYELIELK